MAIYMPITQLGYVGALCSIRYTVYISTCTLYTVLIQSFIWGSHYFFVAPISNTVFLLLMSLFIAEAHIVHIAHCTSVHCTVYTVQIYIVQCTSIHCTVYKCTLASVQVYIVQCISVHCTVYKCTLYMCSNVH